MRSDGPKTYSLSLSGWGFWLGVFGVVLLLSSVGLGWLIAGLLLLLVFLLSLPILILLGVRWWMGRAIASATCPVCGFESQAIEGSRFNCPSCGDPLYVADGQFFHQTPSDVIDVDVYEEY
jgi:hypothetical protein